MIEQQILKYLESGISIEGSPAKGYTVFTVQTQRFSIASLAELTVDRFERAIQDLQERGEIEDQLLGTPVFDQPDLDWQGFIDGKYDSGDPA
jgi:hypothetical protein